MIWVALLPRVDAHPFINNTWWVRMETNRLLCRVSVSLREVAVAQGLGGSTNAVALDSILAALERHAAYVTNSIWVKADELRLPAEVLEFRLMSEGGNTPGPDSPLFMEETHAQFDLEFPRPAHTREFLFGDETLKDHRYAPGIDWQVTYALLVKDDQNHELGAGLVRSGLPYSLTVETQAGASQSQLPFHGNLGPANPESAPPDFTRSVRFKDYLKLGVEHIVHGYDHLLFLAALALAAATLGDFLKLIVTFTFAHSITVTLSALNWVRLPSWFVEPFIAASIIFVAVENLVSPERVSSPRRLAIAFGFGLVHGLGFAGGLNSALGGAGGSALALAILAFCLGVEFGHLAVGLPFWGLLRAGRLEWGDRFTTRALRFGSVLVAAGGSYFLVAALRTYL